MKVKSNRGAVWSSLGFELDQKETRGNAQSQRTLCIRLALVHDMAECIVGDIAPADNIPKEEKHRREELGRLELSSLQDFCPVKGSIKKEAMKQITQLLPEDLRKELCELWEVGVDVEQIEDPRTLEGESLGPRILMLLYIKPQLYLEGQMGRDIFKRVLKPTGPSHWRLSKLPPRTLQQVAATSNCCSDLHRHPTVGQGSRGDQKISSGGAPREYETQSSAEAKFVKQLDQCEMILQASEYEDLEHKPGRLQDFYDSTAGKFSHPEIVQLVSELEAERNANIAAAANEPHS
ncbi:hypothetical protein P7K49_008556 [Saguinus oedipus]|uniref:HD domain-containing protein n=1 Tax=Saguinus oedipus TaxID=9490 RepID=A0ABQ9VY22_SAGOE|nr:hypothetical protein P7K49_008556 [Saguinus oedipus]